MCAASTLGYPPALGCSPGIAPAIRRPVALAWLATLTALVSRARITSAVAALAAFLRTFTGTFMLASL